MYRIIGADGKEYGPITAEQLRQWIAQGRANAQTKAAAEGSSEWKPLAFLPEFSFLFPTAAPPPRVAPIRQNNFFAVAGLVLAVLSFFCCWCCYCGLPMNLAALVFSIIGLVQIRSHPEIYHGQGVAISGVVLSILSLFLGVALLIFWGVMGSLENLSHDVQRL